MEKMKTYYLKIEFRNKGIFYNEGFAIVKSSESRVQTLEAVLTDDFLRMDALEGMLSLKYFSSEDDGNAVKIAISLWIDQELIIVPTIDFTAETVDNMNINIETAEIITDSVQKAKCDKKLAAFKEKHKFILKERE